LNKITNAFEKLFEFNKITLSLNKVIERNSWDQEAIMPVGALADRAEEQASLMIIAHKRQTSNEFSDLLNSVKIESLSKTQLRQVSLMRKELIRALKVPHELIGALAKETTLAHSVWIAARKDNDFEQFLPQFTKVLKLRREEADAIRQDTDLSRYDALLQDYEPDLKSDYIDTIFDTLRPVLVDLRYRVLDRPPAPEITGYFPIDKQRELCNEVAETFGYDFSRGRIDTAVHPFCSGTGNDVRITTRFDENDPLGSIYSTIHEVGHALYEQNIDQIYGFSNIGRGVSMGVHESQSRILENQLGRSESLADWLFKKFFDYFGDIGCKDSSSFYKSINSVKNGFIRTESDELQYNLHVLLRYRLEKWLFDGDLNANDLEYVWNEEFEKDFGLVIEKPSDGILQDVHWSEGLFGYFPTYSLGNVYAGCLFEAMQIQIPALNENLNSGDLTEAIAWLANSVQKHGSLYSPVDLIQNACGFDITAEPLISYIEKKFSSTYNLN
tara:strand:+ start:20420 stop:21916 length:1497 start_codon:yes stop_codon:yes gene_type:complete